MDLDELLEEVDVQQPNSATPVKELSALRAADKEKDAHMEGDEWDTSKPAKPKPERPGVNMQLQQLAPTDDWGHLQPPRMKLQRDSSSNHSREEEKGSG